MYHHITLFPLFFFVVQVVAPVPVNPSEEISLHGAPTHPDVDWRCPELTSITLADGTQETVEQQYGRSIGGCAYKISINWQGNRIPAIAKTGLFPGASITDREVEALHKLGEFYMNGRNDVENTDFVISKFWQGKHLTETLGWKTFIGAHEFLENGKDPKFCKMFLDQAWDFAGDAAEDATREHGLEQLWPMMLNVLFEEREHQLSNAHLISWVDWRETTDNYHSRWIIETTMQGYWGGVCGSTKENTSIDVIPRKWPWPEKELDMVLEEEAKRIEANGSTA